MGQPVENTALMSVYSVGEAAVTLKSTQPVSLTIQQKIWWIADKCRCYELLEVIPGMNNLTLVFDPLLYPVQFFIDQLCSFWDEVQKIAPSELNRTGKEIAIPVVYGGEKGPDLSEVARLHKMSVDEVIKRHSSAVYTVFFIGFMPGFVYLGGLDEQLVTPRRAEPRLQIPAGSVGIGGAQTGIYPSVSPGGWQIIGNTETKLFDPERAQPALLLPGDTLRFTVQEVL